jgi:hypothetical protein
MNTIVKPIPHTVDLNEPVKKTYIDTLLATEDNLAHRFDITLIQGVPSGAAVNAYFIRYNDNATISLTGTVSGNVASVTLNKPCYNKAGQYAIIIKVVADGVTNTVFYGEGTIFTSMTDTILDPENVVPSLSDLLARIAEMEAATEASKTATTNAKSATTKANNAATSANSAATAANTAAEAANAAAQNWGNSTAADSAKLGGKMANEYMLASVFNNKFPRFRNFNINTDDTVTPIDVVIHDHWDEIEDWTQFIAFIENALGRYTTAIGFKIGGGYGAYISISYNQNPMYYRLLNGTWSETALA